MKENNGNTFLNKNNTIREVVSESEKLNYPSARSAARDFTV